MKKIAIVTNFNISEKANAALKVTNYLLKFGCKILVSQYSKERVLAMKNYRGNIYFLPIEKLYDEADLVIALGGDGTILDCAKRMAKRGKPILGINLGHLGYMAEIEMDELSFLSKIIEGDYSIDERSMMDIEVFDKEGNSKYTSYALNDAVISNGSVSKIINLELYAELQKRYDMNIIASGGVSSLQDVSALVKMDTYGAIIGKALYTGAIVLEDALCAAGGQNDN